MNPIVPESLPLRVAVVDDSASSLALLVYLLYTIDGCEPMAFSNSSEGLAWSLANEVDLVIVDHEMPGPNGIDFITAFRSEKSRDGVPVVMVTSTEDRDVRYRALQIGATDFLAKPIDRVEFIARMKNLLDSRRAHKNLAALSQWLADEVQKVSSVVKWQTNYDALTGLPNRMLALDHLSQAMAVATRDDHKVAVMLIDLLRFAFVNDTMGHEAGDEILRQTAKRLLTEKSPTDTVAHLGSGAFMFILSEIGDHNSPQGVAAQIIEKLQSPYAIGDTEIFISAAVGIAISPENGVQPNDVLRSATAAMHAIDADQQGGWRFFTPALDASARQRLTLESSLRHALERGELAVHYQPIVEVATQQTVAAEALLRWTHPEFGSVPPDHFIPIAEETGLIVAIGNWVIETVCQDLAKWAEQGLPPMRVPINISSRQLTDQSLVAVIERALATNNIAADQIELEVTERLLLDKSSHTVTLLAELRAMGLRLSIDDFGTGYSSMSYLSSFPFDVLKIDRSFIAKLTERREDRALTQAIIAMAHILDHEVVAEGVETAEQLSFLHSNDCEFAQGWLFSKALPADRFADYLRQTILLMS